MLSPPRLWLTCCVARGSLPGYRRTITEASSDQGLPECFAGLGVRIWAEDVRGGHGTFQGAMPGAGATPLKTSYLEIRYTVFFIPVSGKNFFLVAPSRQGT